MNFKESLFIIKINKEYRVSSFCWQNLGGSPFLRVPGSG